MFSGSFEHSFDDKGRLIIPSKIRDELGKSFIITKGLDHCLFVYTFDEWKNFIEDIKNIPNIKQKEVLRIKRFYFGNSMETEPDKQNRILISQDYRKYASLKKNVTFVGVENHVEIWDTDSWKQYNGEIDIDEITEKLSEVNT